MRVGFDMKRIIAIFLSFVMLLSGCVFPLQQVSPDPTPAVSADVASPSDSKDFDRPVDSAATANTASVPSAPMPEGTATRQAIDEPRVAFFWYAMADARVEDLRNAFKPDLEASEYPYREYDAENDAFLQLDQIESAVSDGWNILIVNLVADQSTDVAEKIMHITGDCPVIFLDRIPSEFENLKTSDPDSSHVFAVSIDRSDLGRVQGEMIGSRLTEQYPNADLNGDGHISYTIFVNDGDDLASVEYSESCIRAANAVLVQAGLPALQFFTDPLPNERDIFQWSPDNPGSSEGANTLMLANLSLCNEENGNMIELVIAESDEMALGALTALQSSWYNLGDGVSTSIPLFGIGATAGGRTAVDIGQMAGSVDLNAAGIVAAVSDLIVCLINGEELSSFVPVAPVPLW